MPVYTPMMIAAKKDPFLTSAVEEISDVIQRSDLIFMSKPPEGDRAHARLTGRPRKTARNSRK